MRISAVSYINTIPFLFGLENSPVKNQIELTIDQPAICARKLIENKADIGLIPVAALPKIENYQIISDFCIGANGRVNSVFLFSDVEISKIEAVYLDYQSRTSINLMKVLALKYWKISPKWIDAKPNYESKIGGKTAGVVIGDRTFALKNNFKYAYDLSEEWHKLIGLPFVFATWTANKPIDNELVEQLNLAFSYGISHIDKAMKKFEEKIRKVSQFADIKKYLSQDIKYNFGSEQKKALNFFLKEISEL